MPRSNFLCLNEGDLVTSCWLVIFDSEPMPNLLTSRRYLIFGVWLMKLWWRRSEIRIRISNQQSTSDDLPTTKWRSREDIDTSMPKHHTSSAVVGLRIPTFAGRSTICLAAEDLMESTRQPLWQKQSNQLPRVSSKTREICSKVVKCATVRRPNGKH